FAGLFRLDNFVTSEMLHDDVRKNALQSAGECYYDIKKKMEDRKWAVRDEIMVIDAYSLVFYCWGTAAGFDMGKQFPNYTRLVEEVVMRESAQKVMEAEGIDMVSG
ncbi:hypothetical protein CC80DRAFT_427412, partial [Byssothecium circinans]